MSRFISSSLCPVRAKHERRKEARPGELIRAALQLFVEKGFVATRSEEVAARAGVSKGTLFLYFPSKTDLLKAVIAETLAGRYAEWNAEFARFEGTTADMLRHCLDVWWELVGATPASGIAKLMMTEGNNFPELAAYYRREVVEPGHALIRRILRRGVDSGEFAPVDVDHASYAVVSTMAMLTLMRHSAISCIDGTVAVDPRRYLSVQTDLLVGGLLAERPKITDSPRAPSARKSTP
ncbi:MAG TPA: TetR/AcrR family transcriptional regulator [Variovorax sp.]|nr:TetR/AcrR family transcriptional regulator [Variovorax sp.]